MSQGGTFLSDGFLLATLLYRPDLWSAWDIVVTCTQWPVFAIKACSSFIVAIGLLCCLSDHSPPCLVIQFGGTAWSRQGLCGTIRLPPLNDYPLQHSQDIHGLWNIFIPISWSVPFHNFIPEVFWKLLGAHGWVFAVKCTTQQRKLTGTADFILKLSESLQFNTGGGQLTWCVILKVIGYTWANLQLLL